jgi:hypothetical protein
MDTYSLLTGTMTKVFWLVRSREKYSERESRTILGLATSVCLRRLKLGDTTGEGIETCGIEEGFFTPSNGNCRHYHKSEAFLVVGAEIISSVPYH